MAPPVPTSTLLDLSDESDLPLPPPFADGLFCSLSTVIMHSASRVSMLVSDEGGAEEWQRYIDESWQEFQQSGAALEFERKLAELDFSMAEPDFSDEEYDFDIDREHIPYAQAEVGSLLDIDFDGQFDLVIDLTHLGDECEDPNVRSESDSLPPSNPPRSS